MRIEENMVITINIGDGFLSIYFKYNPVKVYGSLFSSSIESISFRKDSSKFSENGSIIVRHFNLLVGVFRQWLSASSLEVTAGLGCSGVVIFDPSFIAMTLWYHSCGYHRKIFFG